MAYIDRGDLIEQLVEIEKECKNAGDEHGAEIACKCRGAVIDQKVVTGVWNNDVCDQCGRKTDGAIEKKYEWCPVCGAEMLNEWTDEDGDDE